MFWNKDKSVSKVKRELTDEELLNLVVERFDLNSEVLSKEDEDRVFSELANVEDFVVYLSSLMSRDVKKHFRAANPAEQVLARGMFARTLYLKSRVLKTRKKATEEADIPSISGRRGAGGSAA